MEATPHDSGRGRLCRRCRKAAAVAPGDLSLDEYVDRVASDLHERVEHQRTVFKSFLADEHDALAYCPIVDCPRLEKLKAALLETIAELEATRQSFKSKRLEVMRRKLMNILPDC